jgi:hypothetical protein
MEKLRADRDGTGNDLHSWAKLNPRNQEMQVADNRKKRGEPDRSTINLNEDYEKEYWKKKFRVSGQALAGAVRSVGKSSKKVEAYLKSK